MSTAVNRVAPVVAGFDVGRVREEFPALKQLVHGKPLVYLDNAATTQKPQLVIDAITHFYQEDCSNIHRGVHLLSERATKAYEDARLAVQKFINAADRAEVIFVRGTTEAINLVAHSYGRTHVQAGDLRDGTPLQHCALADLVRGERREASRRPDERSRRAPAR
jgi:cysteine desulfurase / selenocysteine lyase